MLIKETTRGMMPRPKCCRNVGAIPDKTCFRPEGLACAQPAEVLLTLDEYEAIRLADLEGLYQEQAATLMNVSRQTFGRIIGEAHRKVADVLANGKTLRIEGGPVSIKGGKTARCPLCRHALSLREAVHAGTCPHCRKKP
jgi:uncharacterized protein